MIQNMPGSATDLPAETLILRQGPSGTRLLWPGRRLEAKTGTRPASIPTSIPTSASLSAVLSLAETWKTLTAAAQAQRPLSQQPWWNHEGGSSAHDALVSSFQLELGRVLEARYPGLSRRLRHLLDGLPEQSWVRLVLELPEGPEADLPWELAALPKARIRSLASSHRLSIVRIAAERLPSPRWVPVSGPPWLERPGGVPAAPLEPASSWRLVAAGGRPSQGEAGEAACISLLEAAGCLGADAARISLQAGARAVLGGIPGLLPEAWELLEGCLGPRAQEGQTTQAEETDVHGAAGRIPLQRPNVPLPLDRTVQLQRVARGRRARLRPGSLPSLASWVGALWVRSLTDLNLWNTRTCILRLKRQGTRLSVRLLSEHETCESFLPVSLLAATALQHRLYTALLPGDGHEGWRQGLGSSLLRLLPPPITTALRHHAARAEAFDTHLVLRLQSPGRSGGAPSGEARPREGSDPASVQSLWWEALGNTLSKTLSKTLSASPSRIHIQRGRQERSVLPLQGGPLRVLVVSQGMTDDSGALEPGTDLSQRLDALTAGICAVQPHPALRLEVLMAPTVQGLARVLRRSTWHILVLLRSDASSDRSLSNAGQEGRCLPDLRPWTVPLIVLGGGQHALAQALELSADGRRRLVTSPHPALQPLGRLIGRLAEGEPLTSSLAALPELDAVCWGGPWNEALVAPPTHPHRLNPSRLRPALPWRPFLLCRWVMQRREQHLFVQVEPGAERAALLSALRRSLAVDGSGKRRRLIRLTTSRAGLDLSGRGLSGRGLSDRRLSDRRLSDLGLKDPPPAASDSALSAPESLLEHFCAAEDVFWCSLDVLSPELRGLLPRLLSQPTRATLILESRQPMPDWLYSFPMVPCAVPGPRGKRPRAFATPLHTDARSTQGMDLPAQVRAEGLRQARALLSLTRLPLDGSLEGLQVLGLQEEVLQVLEADGAVIRDPLHPGWILARPAAREHRSSAVAPEQVLPLVRSLVRQGRAQEGYSVPAHAGRRPLLLPSPDSRTVWLEVHRLALVAQAPAEALEAQRALRAITRPAEQLEQLRALLASPALQPHWPELWLQVAELSMERLEFCGALRQALSCSSEEDSAADAFRLRALLLVLDVGVPRFGPPAALLEPEGGGCSDAFAESALVQTLETLETLLARVQAHPSTPAAEGLARLRASVSRGLLQTRLELGMLSAEACLNALDSGRVRVLRADYESVAGLRYQFARFACLLALGRVDAAQDLAEQVRPPRGGDASWAQLYYLYMDACGALIQSPTGADTGWKLELARQQARQLGHEVVELRCIFGLLCWQWARGDHAAVQEGCLVYRSRAVQCGLAAVEVSALHAYFDRPRGADGALGEAAGILTRAFVPEQTPSRGGQGEGHEGQEQELRLLEVLGVGVQVPPLGRGKFGRHGQPGD